MSKVRLGLRVLSPQLSACNGPLFTRRNSPRFKFCPQSPRLPSTAPSSAPAGFGVACHLGVLTGLPCIGVAKKLLQVDGLENNARHKEKIRLLQAGGDTFPLMGDSGAILGMALKSHDHSTKPLYVSVGHKVSLEAAVRLTRSCCRFRIPEPVRQVGGPPGGWTSAHHLPIPCFRQVSWGHKHLQDGLVGLH
ncbi:endonuclease V [Rhinolophus ferrumequinum]|uniref:Endonuclease V n=1 Tax=Rhinolophus ferrumequinum TaxID=59479 RepID=A0A7J7TDJ6_RHIFE|nr:endonuclease V [Rhinolophus ferrumequinum]